MSSLDSIAVRVESASGNIRPLLHEIRHALKRVSEGQDGTVIDLRSLPLAPGEDERIENILGAGELCAELDALGPSVVQETSYAGVWFVTHRNTEGEIVARFIEVTRTPEILRSQQADIELALDRLNDELDAGGGATVTMHTAPTTG